MTLEAEGHTVFEAGDGVEGRAVLQRAPMDAIISDILMPRMDGYRFCYEVRKSPASQTLPLIVYTATYTSPNDEQSALAFGADKYLRKPASAQEILAAIAEVMSAAPGASRRSMARPPARPWKSSSRTPGGRPA